MSSTEHDRLRVRRSLLIGLVAIPLMVACTGTTPAPTSPGSPVAPPPTTAQTEAPGPSATIDATAATRIVARLEELQGFYAQGDRGGIGGWAWDEEAWVAGHLAELSRPAVEVTAYVASVRALRSAVDAGRGIDDAVVSLLAMREAMAARASEAP